MPEAYFHSDSFTEFADALDGSVYAPLPADWSIGATDVVASTAAIAGGGYKAVNMAGAATIAAIANAIGRRDFPFVFGGDGASFAVRPGDRATAEAALAATAAWVRADLGLTLRAALVPVADIRAAGQDVRVARYRVSEALGFAMFAGGGLRWAERALKDGRYAVPAAPDGAQPDLTGLTCRWAPIPAQHGTILSLIVEPLPGTPPAAFASLAAQVLTVFDEDPRHGHPVPVDGPIYRWPPEGLELEVRAGGRRRPRPWRVLNAGARTLVLFVLDRLSAGLGRPVPYRREIALNSDFRKFDDALRLTVDCTPAQVAAVTRLLDGARDRVRYGLHRQGEALMTCFVPADETEAHMHFLDGADGGYARAAQQMKMQVSP